LKGSCTILIADRNPHVREFLKRELTAEGYEVQVAKNGQELISRVFSHEPLDLLILDPDMPDADAKTILEDINDRVPALPLVIHTFLSEDLGHQPLPASAAVVEKKGNSVEGLKQAVFHILMRMDLRSAKHPPSPGVHPDSKG
jgi:CheY-like chemotaxis protein